MRPPRPDIPLPPLPPKVEWVGDGPKRIEPLAARGPVLVSFIELGEANAVRTVPYLREWDRRYRDLGLSVIGVHTPKTPLAADLEALTAGCRRLGIEFPVANDLRAMIWRDYEPQGWPTLFLFRLNGALAWYHAGEGDYADTERAIQELIADAERHREREVPPMPPLLRAMRPEDEPDAGVAAPSDPVHPGGGEPWEPAGPHDRIELEYEGGSAYATADGEGELVWSVDGGPEQRHRVSAPGVYELAAHGRHGTHQLAIGADGGTRIWSLSFAPGVV